MKKSANGSRLEETTAMLQHALATLLQNQALFIANTQAMNDKMDRKFADIDQRLDRIESLLAQMFNELPEKVFGFAQAAKQDSG